MNYEFSPVSNHEIIRVSGRIMNQLLGSFDEICQGDVIQHLHDRIAHLLHGGPDGANFFAGTRAGFVKMKTRAAYGGQGALNVADDI